MVKLVFGAKPDKWCKYGCGNLAEVGIDVCTRCLKKPYKPPRKAGPQWSGDSKYRQETGEFQAKIGR